MARTLVWRGTDGWRAEAVEVELAGEGLRARGTQIGADPLPYRLDYALDAAAGFVTRALDVTVTGDGWRRMLRLARDPSSGAWTIAARAEGDAPLPPPGGDAPALAGALDCDLGLSPLTNAMPVAREALARRAGGADLVMAWVSVPDLAVRASPQRYEHVAPAVVRYVDRGEFEGFTVELRLDADGLVIDYPGLAERVTAS
ncbi:MAG: putative glycolipid-binding domain-containing protein [Thermoleophilia bacterium]